VLPHNGGTKGSKSSNIVMTALPVEAAYYSALPWRRTNQQAAVSSSSGGWGRRIYLPPRPAAPAELAKRLRDKEGEVLSASECSECRSFSGEDNECEERSSSVVSCSSSGSTCSLCHPPQRSINEKRRFERET